MSTTIAPTLAPRRTGNWVAVLLLIATLIIFGGGRCFAITEYSVECVVAGLDAGWACSCTHMTQSTGDVIIASYWDGCELIYEGYLVCSNVCDCSDRFGGIVGNEDPDWYSEGNIGIEFTNSSW